MSFSKWFRRKEKPQNRSTHRENLGELPPDKYKTGDVIVIDSFGRERFRIGRITRGGMGRIYQLHPFDERFTTKALKTILHYTDTSLFEREAEAWFTIGEHPYVARPIWYGQWDASCAIIMDWYDRTLLDVDSKTLSADALLRFSAFLIQGLKHAYDKAGLIHQDIKPTNILVDDKALPRIADFGLARLAHPTIENISSNAVAATSIDMGGTPFYMAPEVICGSAKPSVLSDIYSLGITLYQWLTLEHPYLGPDSGYQFVPSFRKMALEKAVKRYGKSLDRLAAFIIKATSIEPSGRPKSYDDALDMIGLGDEFEPRKTRHNAFDVQKLVLLYRNKKDYQTAEKIVKEAIGCDQTDPMLYNTYAQLLLRLSRFEEATEMMIVGHSLLKATQGIYDSKPYLDPTMNLAKLYIVSQEYEEAEKILVDAWKWAKNGKDERFLEYVEYGWYLLSIGNPENAGDVLLHISESRYLGNHAMRWFTLACHWAGIVPALSNRLCDLWTTVDLAYDATDALCMSLCAVHADNSHATRIWTIVDEQFCERLLQVGRSHKLQKDWYKSSMPDNQNLLAGIVDIATTGGAYVERYSSLHVQRSE
ncbi:MAG: serine/threonine-protein kinase [bacterium]